MDGRDTVRSLVFEPFEDLVEKGKEAQQNADDAGGPHVQPMLKAAKALVREGDKALKKIEPLCDRNLAEYGANFINALKENDEIAGYRQELADLLWEFDDFIDVDDFDAAKFAELQAASRKAAPRILDIIMRMQLRPPAEEAATVPAAPPTPSTIASELRSPSEHVASGRGTPQQVVPPVDFASPTAEERNDPIQSPPPLLDTPLMGAQAGPDLGLDEPRPGSTSERSRASSTAPPPTFQVESPGHQRPAPSVETVADPVPAPSEPDTNPWELRRRPTLEGAVGEDPNTMSPARRDRLSMATDEESDAMSPLSPSPSGLHTAQRPGRLDDGVVRMEQEARHRERETQEQRDPQQIRNSPIYNPHQMMASAGDSRPHDRPRRDESNTRHLPSQTHQHSTSDTRLVPNTNLRLGSFTESPILPQRWSSSSASESVQPSVFDPRARESVVSRITADDHRMSVSSFYEDGSPISPGAYYSPPTTHPHHQRSGSDYDVPPVPEHQETPPSNPRPPMGPVAEEQPGLEALGIVPPTMDVDSGLIPVNPQGPQGLTPPVPLREPDCSIGVNSSFYQYKGFCKGAKEILVGGLGVKKIKKQGINVGAIMVAKCKECLFELDWKLVEADMNKEESVNYNTNGIGFRLRFLSKSHLPAKSIDGQLYGCHFCIQSGRTTEECDATVFFSQKQLFTHLARHPRPLPQVAGLTVIGGPIPPMVRNNFDLHFVNPPQESLLAGLRRELSLLPAATSVDTFRAVHGSLRSPGSGAAVLQFAVGARIVGVEYPAMHGGEWAIGWADNVRGLFPADMVRLEAPPVSEMLRGGGSSNACALAKWKWSVKGKEKETGEWLKFEKGETITNITFPYAEHWCWAGVNAKGKWGIFPQSHLVPNSFRDIAPDRASIRSNESRGIFARMSVRHRPSTSGSDDPPTPRTARPTIL